MEVLQCDGCDFQAESYEDLKTHIQDIHTAFLKPTEAGEQTPESSGSNSLHCHPEDQEDLASLSEHESPNEQAGIQSFDTDNGDVSSVNQMSSNQSMKQASKPASQFFQCRFCIRYFRSKTLLNEHTRKLHGIIHGALLPAQASKESNLMPDGFEKVFSCQYCTYKSPQRARILKHQKLYHKRNLLEFPGSGIVLRSQEPYPDLPENVIQCSIQGKSRGNFACELCSYQTVRGEHWCDHMLEKHRSMVKTSSSFQQLQDEGANKVSSEPSSPSCPMSPPSPNFILKNSSSIEHSPASMLGFTQSSGSTVFRSTYEPANKISPQPCSQMSSNMPNSTESSVLSEKGVFEKANSCMDLEINNSRGSSDEIPEVLDVNSCNSAIEGSTKQLLSEEENKMLEKEAIPFRKHMNQFQCPFCSFLTTHRQSISRHIKNIHLSGNTAQYKCDECHFLGNSQLKLAIHKQCHVERSSKWEPGDGQNGNPVGQNEESRNGVNASGEYFDEKSRISSELGELNPYCHTLSSFSPNALKGLHVHQQQQHSFFHNMKAASAEEPSTEPQDSEPEAYNLSNCVQKTRMSILGFSPKKAVKTARKSINDVPLDLSPLKKRTRIDEIASNLHTKIRQSKRQVDAIINLEEADNVEEVNVNCVEMGEQKEYGQAEWQMKKPSSFHRQDVNLRELEDSEKHATQQLSPSNIPIQLTSEDEENMDQYSVSAESKGRQGQADHDSQEAVRKETGTRFYCKHCEYHNKSARSVSTHYQRMHPYIKFSFRYILDPDDWSAAFRCLECHVEYTTFDDLNQHYREHHPEAINILNLNQPDLVYKCHFCLYTSPNIRSLMPHYQRMHPTVKINNAMIFSSYVVERLPKELPDSQTLRDILKSGPKNFACSTSVMKSPAQPGPVLGKTPESCQEHTVLKESVFNNAAVYDCDICSFTSPNMHSILIHYQETHPQQKVPFLQIQKNMTEVLVECQTTGTVTCDGNKRSALKISNASPLGIGDELYYCKHCVYSNRSVVGVLVHYQKRHPEVKVTAKYIKYAPPTPAVLKLMEDLQIALPKQFLKPLKNNVVDSSSGSLSRSDGDKDEVEMLFFCQHCEYGNRTVKGVLIHCQKKHKDVKATADLVRKHTAVVRSLREKAPLTHSGNASITPCTPDSDKTRLLRSLKCRHCPYASPYVYALRTHLKKAHPSLKAAAITILQWAYQDGILQAGYHCEWCIYSHSEPNGLLMHYQRRHPEHNVDYAYMATKLWAGPDSSASQPQGNSDAKCYRCRNCEFETSSVWDITNHYHSAHPWTIKADESVLLDIINGSHSTGKTQTLVSDVHFALSSQSNIHPFEHSVETLDIVGTPPETVTRLSVASTSISHSPYKCNVCHSEYNSLHGLLTHYGKKHPGMKVKAADFAQAAHPGSVYKCRHCPYVNSRIHGVLTHYQKRHPLIKVTAEEFADDIEQIIDRNEAEEKCKTQRQGYGTYRCKICPYTHGTLGKLKIHYEKQHSQTALEMLKFSSEQLCEGKEHRLPDCSSMSVEEVKNFRAALAEFPIITGEKHAAFRCRLCKYFCSSRKGIARHYRIKHNNARAQPDGINNIFKCALCSYTNPVRKGLAAHYQKRHGIDAYYTHCLAASKTFCEKPVKGNPVVISKGEVPSLSEEIRLSVERKKCSQCSFQTFGEESIISHFNKRHPGVFPKRQNSSKIGCYFSTAYTKEPVQPIVSDENEQTEERPDKEQVNVVECLAFRCIKCFKLSFNTAELLCVHYNDYHSKDFTRDFTALLSSPAQDDCYKCAQCGITLMDLPELGTHLTNHNKELQKRANLQDRWKQDLGKQRGIDQQENNTEKQEVAENSVSVDQPKDPADRGMIREKPVHGGVMKDKPTGGHPCGRCDRVFLSMQGLRSHERSHSASASRSSWGKHSCPYCHFITPFGHSLDRHVLSNHGHHVPFHCQLCPFRTASVSSLESHLQEEHSESESSEPPGVEHRLHHSQLAALSLAPSGPAHEGPSAPPEVALPPQAVLCCQLCGFRSGYIQSLRRHYRDRHGGKKIFKCKECPFFTCYRSVFTVHVDAGHSGTSEQNAADLRCPLCLYHTACKSSMIDHIVLHREGKAGPKEVCRSKLSRHLQGVVFRCHRCTFTCSSAQGLRRHQRKHQQLKPYKCELCFYDSERRQDLQAHLSQEHKVIRNFELVGRVNLDQLEAAQGQRGNLSSAEDEEEGEYKEAKKENYEEEVYEKPERKDLPGALCGETHFRCEFCGRVFVHLEQWERHVLRHGMTVADRDAKQEPVTEAPAHSDSSSVVVKVEGDLLGSSMTVESQYVPDQAKIRSLEEDEEMSKDYTEDIEHSSMKNNVQLL